MRKYHSESQASLLPESEETTIHIAIPIPPATQYSHTSFFMGNLSSDLSYVHHELQ
jgi:hypothetical protein